MIISVSCRYTQQTRVEQVALITNVIRSDSAHFITTYILSHFDIYIYIYLYIHVQKHFLYGWTYAPKRNKQITEEDTGANTSEIDGNAREFNNSQKPASTPAGRAALRNEG